MQHYIIIDYCIVLSSNAAVLSVHLCMVGSCRRIRTRTSSVIATAPKTAHFAARAILQHCTLPPRGRLLPRWRCGRKLGVAAAPNKTCSVLLQCLQLYIVYKPTNRRGVQGERRQTQCQTCLATTSFSSTGLLFWREPATARFSLSSAAKKRYLGSYTDGSLRLIFRMVCRTCSVAAKSAYSPSSCVAKHACCWLFIASSK